MPDEVSGGTVTPPLVTLVVINWNYASYVGAAIQSILAQDYPTLEVIVVDNGSTDNSRAVIGERIGEDPRFRVIHLDTNLGQLGAFFHILDEIRGNFVTIIDADDTLMSNFVSSHVQVHIALPQSVAFTSSNVYEMDAGGRTITGGYRPFADGQQTRARQLPRVNAVPRLATVSDRDYWLLSEATSTIPFTQIGWFWGPGTSNMYRRSVLNEIRQQRGGQPYLRAADAYLNPFCHALGSSALIHLPLSGYRVHDTNYFAIRESMDGMRTGRPEIEAQNELLNCETIEFLFRNADRFVETVNRERFWKLIDHISLDPQSRRLWGLPYLQTALVENFGALTRIFGERGLYNALIPRMRSRALRAVIRRAHGGRVPLKLRLMILRKSAKRRLVHWREKRAVRRAPQTTAGRVQRNPQRDFGPIAVLSYNPPVFKSGIAFDEFLGIAPAFGKRFGDVAAGFIIYPTWTIENSRRVTALAAAASAHRKKFKNHRLLFLCNTQREADVVSLAGQPAVFLNKNITVSETIFRPLADATVEFDAIYNARFVPGKRHELTAKIDRVAYLGYAEASSMPLEDQQRRLATTLAGNPSHTLLNPLRDGLPVRVSHHEANAALNRAAVGLCLSEAEGSNYASMEYMLAGLPVVSTPSVGGRDVFFDPEYCLVCEPNAEAVRDAVAAIKARKIPRDHIRARTLAKIEPERRRFLMIADDLIASLGGRRRFDGPWPFAATSGMVAWGTFADHLLEFERVAANALAGDENAIGMHISSSIDLDGVQLHPTELRPIVKAITSRPQCSLLVFGCGNDSVLWQKLNRNGTTAFIEDDPKWLELARTSLTTAQVHLVSYDTKRSDWLSLLNSPDKLNLDLPDAVSARRWDVVLVDGPAGYDDGNPGRMKSIYAASKLVAPGGCVFIHDCDRPIERQFAARYLGDHRLFVEAKGRSILNGYAF